MRAADEAVSGTSISGGAFRVPDERATGALAWLMLLYVVVTVGRVGSLVKPLESVPLAKIVAALAILVALRRKDLLAPVKVFTLPPVRLMIALMALATVSIVFSVLRSGTLGVIDGTVLSVTIGTVLIVKAAGSWHDSKVLLRGCVASAAILALLAMTTSDNGRAGYISAYDPNDFAFVLIMLLPVVVTFAVTSRGLPRLLYLAVSIWTILTILRTESRGGLLGLLIVTLVMAVLLPKGRRGQLDMHLSLGRTLGRLLLIVAFGVVIWGALPTTARTRLSTITSLSSDYNANVADGGRLTIWVDTLPLIVRRPWGYGAGAFTTVDGLFAGGRYRAPHNMFLQALIELGVVGLILFVALLVTTLRLLGQARATGPPQDPDRDELERGAFARALMAALIGACVSGFFLSELYSQALWVFVALACVVARPVMSSGAQSGRNLRAST